MNNSFTDGLERKLESQFLRDNSNRKTAYICSPLRAESKARVLKNIQAARSYMYYADKYMGLTARAPHAYLPMLLDDRIPVERALALEFGLRLLEISDVILVCGCHLSSGMTNEILHAAKLNMKILVFNEELFYRVGELVAINVGQNPKVLLDTENSPLALHSFEIEDVMNKEGSDDMSV